MIRRISIRPSTRPYESAEEVLAAFAAFEQEVPAELPSPDMALEVLLKHALDTNAPAKAEADGGHVWQQLTRKMRGPFGAPVLEAPGISALDSELMASGGVVQLAPFAISDRADRSHSHETQGRESLWAMLRLVSSSAPQRGQAWMLS